jgi:hypothetical protein
MIRHRMTRLSMFRKTRLSRVILTAVAAIGITVGAAACGTERISIPKSDPTYKVDLSSAELFNQRCGGCHTLSIAGTQGSGQNPRTFASISGPNFDVTCMRPAIRVLYAIENGGFSGAYMPQNIVVGAQARELAEFVSKFAGMDAKTQPGAIPCSKQPIGTLPTPPKPEDQ